MNLPTSTAKHNFIHKFRLLNNKAPTSHKSHKPTHPYLNLETINFISYLEFETSLLLRDYSYIRLRPFCSAK